MTIEEARKQNREYYFTGVPCVRGQIARRLVRGKCCQCEKCLVFQKERLAIARKKSKTKHQAKYTAKARIDRIIDGDRIRARDKLRRDTAKANGEVIWSRSREYIRLQNAKSKEKNLQTRRLYRSRFPERVRGYSNNYVARKKKVFVERVTPSRVAEMLELQGGLCNACLKDIRQKPTIDHIVAINRGGLHTINNLQLLCKSCNSAKSDRDMGEWDAICIDKFGRLPRLPDYFNPCDPKRVA